ncbi:MAG: glucosaminidase domain-containing protein [Saprospiraceae bacterium]
MHRDQANGFHVEWDTKQTDNSQNRKNAIQNETYYVPLHIFNPIEWAKKMVAGLQKLYVASKYQFFQLTGGIFGSVQISWFKVAMVGLILFAFIKKDFRFQINLRAPNAETQMAQGQTDEMGLVKAVSLTSPVASLNIDFISLSEIDDRKVAAYIKRFEKVAKVEMVKYGIPASIKMAQAILESQANMHPRTRKTNNHFGQILATQSYDSAWANWRAHSNFITKSKFKALLDNDTDVKGWAKDLQAAGYSNDPNYSNKLLQIIEKYNLAALDR